MSKLSRANLALHDKSSTSKEKDNKNDSMMKHFQDEEDQHRRFLVTGHSSHQREDVPKNKDRGANSLGKHNHHMIPVRITHIRSRNTQILILL